MKTITMKEIKKEIEELENRIFLLDMIDKWTSSIEDTWVKLNNRLDELKKQLAVEGARV